MTQCRFALLATALFGIACAADPNEDGWTPPDMSNAVSAGANGGGLPQLHVDGKFFKNPAGEVVILRGVDLIDLKTQDTEKNGQTVNSLIDLLSDASQGWHSRIVRLMVSPKAWIAGPDAYFETYLKPAVDHATERGLYAIIDWHYIEDVNVDTDRTTRDFWTYVAPRFATYTNVFYELFNEPKNQSDSSWLGFKQWAQPWVDLVRMAARDNIILIGGPLWSQQIGHAADLPFHGENLAYVAHVYPQLAKDLWGEGGVMTQAARARPVMVTEWGFRDGAAQPCSGTQASFGVPFQAWVEKYGLSWSAWVAHTSWQPEMFSAGWVLRGGEANMGQFVKDWLTEKKDSNQAAPATSL